MDVLYRVFQPSDAKVVGDLMQNLYYEDPGGKPMTIDKIRRTFDTLTREPDRGTILVFELDQTIIGYAILINFWSNEYGGNIINIDELYIAENYRSLGIGTDFINYLVKNRFGNAVALQLEVTPGNTKARRMYERIGFRLHKNETLTRELEQSNKTS